MHMLEKIIVYILYCWIAVSWSFTSMQYGLLELYVFAQSLDMHGNHMFWNDRVQLVTIMKVKDDICMQFSPKLLKTCTFIRQSIWSKILGDWVTNRNESESSGNTWEIPQPKSFFVSMRRPLMTRIFTFPLKTSCIKILGEDNSWTHFAIMNSSGLSNHHLETRLANHHFWNLDDDCK